MDNLGIYRIKGKKTRDVIPKYDSKILGIGVQTKILFPKAAPHLENHTLFGLLWESCP